MGKAAKADASFDGKSLMHGEISLAEDTFLKPHVHFDKGAFKAMRVSIITFFIF